MWKLLQIEWLKLKNYKTFNRLIIIYFLLLLFLLSSVKLLLMFLEGLGMEFEGISPSIIPFYDFPDVWQNLTYLASYLKFFLGFIVIISVTNEFSFRTIRQNIIDGMSPQSFLWSKQVLIFTFSLVNMLVLFVAGTIMGFIHSSTFEPHLFFTGLEFLLAHFVELITFLNICVLISLLLKKAGFAIIVLCFYALFVEPPFVWFLSYMFDDHWLISLFPIAAVNNLIETPFKRYIFLEIQNYVAVGSLLIALGWYFLSLFFNYLLIAKRDIA